MTKTLGQRTTLLVLGVALPLVVLGVGCSATPAANTNVKAANAITAQLSEWKVDLGTSTLAPGVYEAKIQNSGKVEHELIAFRVASSTAQLPLDTTGRVNEEADGIVATTDGDNVVSGASQSRTIDLKTPGTYVFLCNLPAHYGLGMHTVVTVA